MLKSYKRNKDEPVGAEIECPVCKTNFIKKKDSHAFCCIPCKDDFWNKVDPRKRNNNGKNRGQLYISKEPYWCDDDLADCEYHNKGGGMPT